MGLPTKSRQRARASIRRLDSGADGMLSLRIDDDGRHRFCYLLSPAGLTTRSYSLCAKRLDSTDDACRCLAKWKALGNQQTARNG